MSHTPLVLGQPADKCGDVTQNRWVGARSGPDLERSLGYGTGRLAAGWWVLLLKQTLTADDFQFGGITLRSGGREGLPADTSADDELRPRVHDRMQQEYGPDGYLRLQTAALDRIKPTGPDRLVKVVPVTPHDEALPPSQQYPMGGGGLQWRLRKPCSFLVAMKVDAAGVALIATTPPRAVFLGPSAAYDDRALVARFLDQA